MVVMGDVVRLSNSTNELFYQFRRQNCAPEIRKIFGRQFGAGEFGLFKNSKVLDFWPNKTRVLRVFSPKRCISPFGSELRWCVYG